MKNLPEQYVEIWNTQNIQALPTILSESAYYQDASQEGNAREILGQSIVQTAKAFPDVSFRILSLMQSAADEGLFILEWLMRGTNKGPFLGAEPTNKELTISGVDLIKVDKEAIIEIKSYFDSSQFATQLEI